MNGKVLHKSKHQSVSLTGITCLFTYLNDTIMSSNLKMLVHCRHDIDDRCIYKKM